MATAENTPESTGASPEGRPRDIAEAEALVAPRSLGGRPRAHFTARSGWLNDPNGLALVDGVYHLFYQTNPFSPEPPSSFWGHAISQDLITWQDLPLALGPFSPYDADGCYTGSAVADGDVLRLVYTGHLLEGDGYVESVNIAESVDGVTFVKCHTNPVIAQPPADTTMRFRDPKVWREGERYYLVVGSQDVGGYGKVNWYKSSDLTRFSHLGSWSCQEGSLGSMWECPNYAVVDDASVLIVSPKGGDPERRPDIFPVDEFGCCYTTGLPTRDPRLASLGQDMRPVDKGLDFYAPQILETPERTLMWGWFATPSSPTRQSESATWEHAFTLPRELHVTDGVLRQSLPREFEALRGDVFIDVSLANACLECAAAEGEVVEVLLKAVNSPLGDLALRVRDESDDGLLALSIDSAGGRLSCNGRARTLELGAPISDARMVVDGPYLELFLNGGSEVLSCRMAPHGSAKLFLSTAGDMHVRAFTWK